MKRLRRSVFPGLLSRFAGRPVKGLLIMVAILLGGGVTVWAKGPTGREVIPLRVRPFDLKQVRLLDGPFKDAMERDRGYLHDLEADRLLHMFRVNAGLPSSAEPLGGWERPDCELRGHTLGHYLSACALMFASTGDEKLKAKADAIVSELARCQKAIGTKGYLSAFPETWFDRVESFRPVWAPYYTIHKILAGLLDMFLYCDNEEALEILRGMIRWIQSRTARLDEAHMQRMLNTTEQGGMNDVLSKIYAVTGDPDHLALARRFDQRSYNDPLARREDRLRGLHVNSFIPNIIGTAREHELAGEERDRDIAEYFWNQVVHARSYATGGTSNHEAWRTEPYRLATELSPESQETCCTYNMLKLTRHLIRWDPRPKYADFYERALYNSILATQDPETGMMMYYVALNPGHWKVFNTPRDSFWCCTGTGMENHAKYGDSIYFHDDDSVFVNLFIASELDWEEKGVRIRQETRFPLEERTTFILRTGQPVELALRVRVPYWATRGVRASVNGREVEVAARPSSYMTFKRKWTDGDRVDVSLPMSLHLQPMPDDPNLAAILYGPLVLAGEMGTEKFDRRMQYCKGQRDQNNAPRIEVPDLVVKSDDVADWIKPVEGEPLWFRAVNVGQDRDITLVPFHRLFAERYAIYWRIYRKGSEAYRKRMAEVAAQEALAARTVDRVEIGQGPSEREHGLRGEATESGEYQGRPWRHARESGWFSYTMKVLSDRPAILRCTYWGSDAGTRTFDILIDGEKVATQALNANRPDEFFDVDYPISLDLTRGKEEVTVKFQAHPGNWAGGVFGCATLKER